MELRWQHPRPWRIACRLRRWVLLSSTCRPTRSSFLFAGSEPRSQRFVRMPARNDRATRPPSSDHSRGLDLAESPVNTTRLRWTYFEVARKFACIPGVPPERHDPSLSMSTGRIGSRGRDHWNVTTSHSADGDGCRYRGLTAPFVVITRIRAAARGRRFCGRMRSCSNY